MFASGVDVGKVVLPKFSLQGTRCYRSLNLKQKRNCIVAKLAEIPIHHQSPEELLKTVVGGSNCIVVNRNFWLRCANAVLHHSNNFTATELIRIADSFGKVKHQDSSLFKEIAVRLLKCHESWRLNDIPRLLSAFRACSVFDEQLFSSALLIIQKNLESIGADDLTSILHSLTVTTEQALFRQIMDDLVSPIFTKISNFSLENIVIILNALAHLKYRNVALLQVIADHVAGGSYSHGCYPFIKALKQHDYLDANVVKIIRGLVHDNAHIIHVHDAPKLLDLLLWVNRYTEVELTSYQAIVRSLSQDQENADWKALFGAKAALESIKYSDIYLDELCRRIKELCCHNLTSKDRLNLLHSCENYPLPLVYLYDAVLYSFEKCADPGTPRSGVIDPSVTNEDFMDLLFLFSNLRYVKGVFTCVKSIAVNRRNIGGVVAIKCRELMLQHFEPLGLKRAQNNSVKRADAIQRLMAGNECAKPSSIGLSIKSDASTSNTDRNLFPRYLMTDQFECHLTSDDLTIVQDAWSYIEIACRSATPLEYALGICQARSVDYVCQLIPPLLDGMLSELEAEIIPAMLNKTMLICHKNGCTPEAIKRLHSSMFSLLGNKRTIRMLSPISFSTLIGVLNRVEHVHAEKVLDLMIECCVERMSSTTEDGPTVHLHCNNAFKLLSVCVKKSRVDATHLAKGICSNAHHLEKERVPQLLHLLTKMGFKDGRYISMLEPIAEKAMAANSDTARILKLEVS